MINFFRKKPVSRIKPSFFLDQPTEDIIRIFEGVKRKTHQDFLDPHQDDPILSCHWKTQDLINSFEEDLAIQGSEVLVPYIVFATYLVEAYEAIQRDLREESSKQSDSDSDLNAP